MPLGLTQLLEVIVALIVTTIGTMTKFRFDHRYTSSEHPMGPRGLGTCFPWVDVTVTVSVGTMVAGCQQIESCGVVSKEL